MKILGAFEIVSFEELGLFNVVAKTDTGAYTGSLHATDIEEITQEGKSYLRFVPFGNTKPVSFSKYHKHWVKSSNGTKEDRYIIETSVTIDNQTYPITISLTDRTSMRKGILLGRRFIKQNYFLVDVNKGSEYVYHEKDSV